MSDEQPDWKSLCWVIRIDAPGGFSREVCIDPLVLTHATMGDTGVIAYEAVRAYLEVKESLAAVVATEREES